MITAMNMPGLETAMPSITLDRVLAAIKKVSQFIGLMGDEPESAEDRTLSAQASTNHMQRMLAKLRGQS